MFAFEGEDAIIIDELPDNATPSQVDAIMAEVHQESVAAVMAQGDMGGTSSRAWVMDRPARPRSGLFKEW